DGEVHSGRFLLDHPVIQRTLTGLALVVLQHVGLERELELGDVAGRAHFDGKAFEIALSEEDAALKTCVGAHDLDSLRWMVLGSRGIPSPCGWSSGTGWRSWRAMPLAMSQSAVPPSTSSRSPALWAWPAWVCG